MRFVDASWGIPLWRNGGELPRSDQQVGEPWRVRSMRHGTVVRQYGSGRPATGAPCVEYLIRAVKAATRRTEKARRCALWIERILETSGSHATRRRRLAGIEEENCRPTARIRAATRVCDDVTWVTRCRAFVHDTEGRCNSRVAAGDSCCRRRIQSFAA